MNCRVGFLFAWSCLLSGGLFTATTVLAQGPQPKPAANVEMDVLTRGPLHEGFAIPVHFGTDAKLIVDRQPPEMIQEFAPSHRPQGNVEWIPGYWSWDNDLKDFIWISGIWRDAPPERRWIPGYWQPTSAKSFAWMSGFWYPTDAQNIELHPAPPVQKMVAPQGNAPSDNHFWVPGNWQPENGKYVWHDGFWSRHEEGHVWIPMQNTPSADGFVHVPGYWDYPIDERGTIFAPVQFKSDLAQAASIEYTPDVAVPADNLQYHLFADPRRNSYMFGNYYDPSYANQGILPWYRYYPSVGYIDPLVGYNSWYYGRQGSNYLSTMGLWNSYYLNNNGYRPALTYRQQLALAQQYQGQPSITQSLLGLPLSNLVQSRPNSFLSLSQGNRTQISTWNQQMQALARARLQAQAGNNGVQANPSLNTRLNLPAWTRPLIDGPQGSRTSAGFRGVDPNNLSAEQRQQLRRQQELQRQQDQPRQIDPRGQLPGNVDPRNVNPRNLDPRNVDPRNLEPRQNNSRNVNPQNPPSLIPRSGNPLNVNPQNAIPRNVQPQNIVPKNVQPQNVIPKNIVPNAVPRQEQPSNVAPPQRGPRGPGNAGPGNASPGKGNPGNAGPGNSNPGGNRGPQSPGGGGNKGGGNKGGGKGKGKD